MLKAALSYARRGWPVFPCEPGGKRPLTPKGHLDATTDPRRIVTHWSRTPDANIGVVTGSRSGLLVLDADDPISLETLELEHGKLPTTRAHATGNGGTHHLYLYPAKAEIRNSVGKLSAGLDVRGEGGYIIAPPSRTNRPYEILDRLPLAKPPAWLLTTLTRLPKSPLDASRRPEPVQSSIPEDPIPEGQRNDRLYRYGCALRAQGFGYENLLAELKLINARLCSPPLQTAELELIATSAARHEPGNMAPHPDRRTLEALDLIAGELMSRDWPGMGAKSSRDVYAALIVAARRHGRMIPAGVRVSIGLRPLALAAAVGSVNTVRKALDRLRLAGLIRRDDGNRRGAEAGAFVLIPPAQR